jgi:hypothetical protein
MVSMDKRNNIKYQLPARDLKTVYTTGTKTKKMDALETTDRYDVTATGAPS